MNPIFKKRNVEIPISHTFYKEFYDIEENEDYWKLTKKSGV